MYTTTKIIASLYILYPNKTEQMPFLAAGNLSGKFACLNGMAEPPFFSNPDCPRHAI
jgi:hypothetical protein